MARSISWIDRSELAGLLRRVRAPAGAHPSARELPSARPAPPPPPPAPSPARLAPTRSAPPVSARPAAAPIVTLPERGTMAVSVDPIRPFEPPTGTLEARAEALLGWVEEEIECEGAFVTDEHGLAIVERRCDPEILAVSATLMSSVQHIRAFLPDTLGSITLALGPSSLMSFVLADSEWGQLGAGVLSQSRPPETALSALTEAVGATFANPGSQG